MQRKHFYATQLMKISFQALMYLSLFLTYFGMLSITNYAILTISRTAAATMATFFCSMLLLTAVYGGYDIDIKKKRTVFASVSLTTFFTDAITYIILQIMNTNPKNPEANATLTLISEDLALMAGAFVLQLGIIYLFVSLGYSVYFRINPPQDCCIITSSQELAQHVASKLYTHRRKYRLTIHLPGKRYVPKASPSQNYLPISPTECILLFPYLPASALSFTATSSMVATTLFLPILRNMETFVPLPTSLSKENPSINVCIMVNPMPDRSSFSKVV